MKLALMRFAGYSFSTNPISIEIKSAISTASFSPPYNAQSTADTGTKCKVISGKGKLYGEDCLSQYKELLKLHLSGREGILSVPGIEPVYALFSKLDVDLDTTPDTLVYSFEFTEVSSGVKADTAKGCHMVTEGETLFDIAYTYKKSVDELVELNPWIIRPDELLEGQVIKLC